METRLENIEAKFASAFDQIAEFDLLGKTADELNMMRHKAERVLNRLREDNLKLDNFAKIVSKTSLDELRDETQTYRDVTIEVVKGYFLFVIKKY